MAEEVKKDVEPAKVPTAKEKYPALWAQFEKLQAEKAELEKAVAPLREQRDAVETQMAPLVAKSRDLAKQIRTHAPKLGELDRQIAALARAMGGKLMSQSAS